MELLQDVTHATTFGANWAPAAGGAVPGTLTVPRYDIMSMHASSSTVSTVNLHWQCESPRIVVRTRHIWHALLTTRPLRLRRRSHTNCGVLQQYMLHLAESS